MTVAVTAERPDRLPVDLLVVGMLEPGHPDPRCGLPDAARAALAEASALLDCPDEAAYVIPSVAGLAARYVALVLLAGGPRPDALRVAAARATRSAHRFERIGLALGADDAAEVAEVATGALLGGYRYTRFRTGELPPREPALLICGPPSAGPASEQAQVVAAAVNATRDLVNTPANHLGPAEFATAAVAAADGLPLAVDTWDHARLATERFGGIVGVGQGSARPPVLVKLAYRPPKARRHIALVGKGVTFDAGGISLKRPDELPHMNDDMAGAAAVLHAAVAAARLRLNVAVTAWLPLAENLPSGSALRPSDVLTMRDGRTVEVRDTDLEGRLLLADALAAAVAERPDAVVDVATLTSAQTTALGSRTSALMAGDDALAEALLRAAAAAGEPTWRMPLPAHLRAALRSDVADLANQGEHHGTMLTAGLFLQEFADGVPWAHLDICGTARNPGPPHGVEPTGATGVMVRTLLQFLDDRPQHA